MKIRIEADTEVRDSVRVWVDGREATNKVKDILFTYARRKKPTVEMSERRSRGDESFNWNKR